MAEMLGIAEIAKRLNLEGTTVRRLIARESESLGLQVHRGKGDKTLLTKDDAEKLIAYYEARRGPTSVPDANQNANFDRYGYFYTSVPTLTR